MIPKIIHLIWFDKPTKRVLDEYINFKVLNPNWTVILWEEESLYNQFPFLRIMEEKGCDHAWKSDYARIFLINKYGGIYSDIDAHCLRAWDEVPDKVGDKILVCGFPIRLDPGNIETHVIGCPVGGIERVEHLLLTSDVIFEVPVWQNIIRIQPNLFISPQNWFNAMREADAVYSIHNDRRLESWREARALLPRQIPVSASSIQ